MLHSLAANILGFGVIPILAVALFAGAVAAYMYIPLVGPQIALVLIAVCAAVVSYDVGYNERAALDKSAALQSNIAALRAQVVEDARQATAAAQIAQDAQSAEQTAEANAAAVQQKVDAYDSQLSTHPECALSATDVGGLLGIGGDEASPAKSPSSPGPVRSPRPVASPASGQ
jgi:hypothetical protein